MTSVDITIPGPLRAARLPDGSVRVEWLPGPYVYTDSQWSDVVREIVAEHARYTREQNDKGVA